MTTIICIGIFVVLILVVLILLVHNWIKCSIQRYVFDDLDAAFLPEEYTEMIHDIMEHQQFNEHKYGRRKGDTK